MSAAMASQTSSDQPPTAPAPTHTLLNTSVPSINAGAPVELDSTPVSPVSRKESWKTRPSGTLNGPGTDQRAYEELSGEQGENENLRQKRQSLLEARSKDPSVLVDLPTTPRAEEYEIAQAGLGEAAARRSSAAGVTLEEVATTKQE